MHLGVRLSKASAEYARFRCVPSEQFAGHTWCTRQQPGRESRGKFEATYSLLHAADGTIVYINRFQAPAYWTGNEVDDDIQRQAKKIGTEPNILKLPNHSGSTRGTIAIWGKVNLQPLDQTSIAALEKGRVVKMGLLVDYIGDFTRSARAGLPIYQILGGAGFGWIASYGANGRGTLRFFAADASAFTERQQQVPNVAAPLPSQEDRATVGNKSDTAGLALASTTPAALQKSQLLRNGLFKDLQANAKSYKFQYVVVELPAGLLPGINHSIPVTFIRYESIALFAFDRFTLEPAAETIVSDFARTILQDGSYRSIVIVGHTDSIGTDEYNHDLSKNRALTVATALRTHGIPDKYLSVVPMGKAQPIETNHTPEGRASNRRVEFFISDIPGASEAVIKERPINPCHIREDCAVQRAPIPILSSAGDLKGELLLRTPLPKNSDTGFVRPPLPEPDLKRPSLKELQLPQ